MFDKITHVEAVHVAGGKPNGIATYLFPATAIVISLLSALASWWSYRSNQEGLKVVVSRDLHAEIGVGRPARVEIKPEQQAEFGLIARWNVVLVNTSITATIPVTSYRILNSDYLGAGEIIDSDQDVIGAHSRLLDIDNKDLELPVSLKPGEVRRLVLIATTAVSKTAGASFHEALPSTPAGEYRGVPAPAGYDAFGNKGRDMGMGFEASENRPAREPCVAIEFESGRGNTFDASGYWYRNVSYTESKSGAGDFLGHVGCSRVPSKSPFD